MALLLKISDDVAPERGPRYSPRYVEENGTPMHGVFIREYKKSIHKCFINNGHLMARYIYPRIQPKFHSPLVNDYNLHLCGGWCFHGVNRKECITRVIQGLKPIGYFSIMDPIEYEYWLNICSNSGLKFTTLANNSNSSYEIGISINGKLNEIFNIPLLISDYSDYITSSFLGESVDAYTKKITDFISSIANKDISEFLSCDYNNIQTEENGILTGLTLGYPIETTVACLWGSII